VIISAHHRYCKYIKKLYLRAFIVLFRPSVHTFGKFWSKKLQKKSDNSKEKHFG
jgi:uncharacterized protein YebE (UPF0316 family)